MNENITKKSGDQFYICNVKTKIMFQSFSERITFNVLQCNDKPCIRGMRIRVSDVLALSANGLTNEDIVLESMILESDDIKACLFFSLSRVDHPVIKAA